MGDHLTKIVAVTGAGGFIGSHLVESLIRSGYRVRALVHYNSCGSIGLLGHTAVARSKSLEIVRGDIRDPSVSRSLIKGCFSVFHLAALIGVPYSFTAPVSYLDTNTCGTVNLLEAVRHAPETRLVFASTSEIFGNNPKIPIDEDAPLLPTSPYAASKVAAEKFVFAYSKSYPDIDSIIVRPFNTYGPRQSLRAVIPVIIQQALEGGVLQLGNPDTRRDFLYVEDLVNFYVRLLDVNRLECPVLNVGSGVSHSIHEIAETIARLLGKSLQIERDIKRLRPMAAEVHHLLCDIGLVRRVLNWEPTTSLEEGLQNTIEWMAANPKQEGYAV